LIFRSERGGFFGAPDVNEDAFSPVYNTELKTSQALWASTVFCANKPMAEFTAGDTAPSPPQVKF